MRHLNRAMLIAAMLCSTPGLAIQPPPGEPIVLGTSHALTSNVLGEERRINVRLPAGYDPAADRRYPVLYVLDGGTDQDFTHIAGLAQHAEMSGTFETFITVGIPTRNRIWELTTPNQDERYTTYIRANGQPVEFANGGGAETFRRHIAEEVVPFIESHYKAGPRRIFMGESLAAYFVVDTLLRRPALFQDYVAISPSLWWNREELANNARALLPRQDFSGKRLYITMASEGGTMQRGLDTLLATLRSTAASGLRWLYVDRRNSEHHGSIYHVAALDALRALDPKPWRPGTPLAWLHVGEMPPLSEAAEADKKIPCTAERAQRVSFSQVTADPARWEAFCILSTLGDGPEPRERSTNWDPGPSPSP